MHCFAFRIHYQCEPRRIGHVLMNAEDVMAALNRFRAALPAYMAELGASAEVPQAGSAYNAALRVVVHTRRDWAQTTAAMTGYADRHGLCATPVTTALVSVASGPAVAAAPGRNVCDRVRAT